MRSPTFVTSFGEGPSIRTRALVAALAALIGFGAVLNAPVAPVAASQMPTGETAAADAQAVAAGPVLGGQLFSTGAAVQIEVLGGTAALTSTLFLLEPEEVRIATNRDVGTVVTVGPYGSGEELLFGIRVNGQEFRMGAAERNPDGLMHATVEFLETGCAIVGFEDLFGGGDRDYDDNRFRFCGGISSEPPDPTEPPPPPPFVPPNADAGDDQEVPEGSIVTLDGTRSTASTLQTRTWTTTADFAEGGAINLSPETPDQLQLDDTTEAFDFIWIAASNRGTVIKIDTGTGEVLGEYRSAPQNRAKDPSRTTVDHNGSVWVGNRAETSSVGGAARGSVAHIGLLENGQCEDRNGNGVIDTSSGLGNILAWPNSSGVDNDGGVETAADECIIDYVRTNGVAIRQVSVDADNHVWVGGAAQGGSPSFFDRVSPDGAIVRTINMRAPAQTGESSAVVCCYGGLIDPAGILWSSSGSSTLVRIDPSKPNGHADLVRVTSLGRTSYGLGIDPDGFLWQSNWTANTVQKISPAGALLGTFSTGGASNDRGVAATADGDIWVANSGGNSVSRLRSNGTTMTVVAVITVGQQPTGVAVDAAGKVWASNLSSSTASRINPATNVVDLTVSLGSGAGPYNYSDMTGSTLTGAPDEGTWSVVYDSETEAADWAFADWSTQLPGDASLTVTVASSSDGTTFGPEVAVTDGAPIEGLADGRYLRVTARFKRSTAGDAPVLFDLTVAHEGDRPNTLSYKWRLTEIDGPPIFLSSTTSATPSFVAPDDATYKFELTVTDTAGLTDTDEVTVQVTNENPGIEAEIGSAFARAATLLDGSFTDPGWLDAHTARIDWGDGSPIDVVNVTVQGTGWGTFFGSHVYAAAGLYPVRVTLTDDDGGTAAQNLGQVNVAEPVAVWANNQTEKKTLEWAGGAGTITGRVHSNNEVKISGTEPKSIVGPTEYVGAISVTGPHTLSPVKSTVQPFPVTYDLADYAPGGAVSVQVGAAYFNHTAQCVGGLWDVGSQVLPVGVHYAPCSVKLNGSSIKGRVTLAATGTIELSGSNPAFEPYHDGLLLLAGSNARKAINISASSSKFLGVVYAGRGEVSLSGSNSKFFCGIYGDRVAVSGFNLTIRGANCGRPDSTVSGPLLVPELRLSLDADRVESLPGRSIAYALEVANEGSLLSVPGLLGLENVDTAAATVTGLEYALEYYSIADSAWLPIATLDDGISLTAHGNTAPGVTYTAPDAIEGTVIAPGGFASWGYQALVDLTPDEVRLLLDPTRVGGFRNRVEFTLDPASVQVRRLFTFGTDFVGALRTLSGDIVDPSLTFVPPAGDLVVEDVVTNPALAVLTPGERVSLDETFVVPVPAPRSQTETDAGYLTRLLSLDGTPLVGSSFAFGHGGVGRLVAPLVTATTTERLPVVSISTLGPDSIPAGTTATYDLKLANLGSAPAPAPTVAVGATAAGSSLTVLGAPPALVAGELATATTSYTAPLLNPPADVTVTGDVSWSDAAGNDYGPVRSSVTSPVLTPATLSATLVDTLQVDVAGDGHASPGDTVRYSLIVSNRGGQALSSVVADVEPDPNSALVVGSVATAAGTVVEGNTAGDTGVAVEFGTVPGNGFASLVFDAVVDDPFPSGVARLEVQGTVSADGFEPVLTDDPARPGLSDHTRTTVVVPVANLVAFLSGRLQLDPDGNGVPTAGDTLRYELVVNSVGSLAVTDVVATLPTPAGTSVVPGSVTTDTGTVVPGDGVIVDVGDLQSFEHATIGFDLVIANPMPAGLTAVSAQATVSSNELADIVSDDPNTFTVGDRTVITIGGGGGGGGGTPGVPGPAIGGVSLAEGTVVTEPTDVGAALTPPAGETITGWKIFVGTADDPDARLLAEGTGTTASATIDPTVLPNGPYVVTITASGSAGGVSVFETNFVVEGQLKLGRYQITYQDLSVGVAGLPMQVLRTYDSFDKSRGDFGIGWRLELSNFRVSTNGPLGEGGWTMFGCGPGLIFVPLCFESSRKHYVTVTWPDGRVEIFDLTPARGSTFLPGLTSAQFTGRDRTTSTLRPVDSSLYFSNGNLLGGFFGSDGIYDPRQFVLTDRLGTEYLLDRDRGLVSAKDRNGNTLTVSANGIVSSLGPSITFGRDPQGRIAKVTGPAAETLTYTYDPTTGDLASYTDQAGRTVRYEYDADHNLKLTRDPLNRPFQIVTYGDDGRLESVEDAVGNVTLIDVDPEARTETITDPEGRLVTISTMDERGNVTERRQLYDGKTATTTFAYDEFDNIEARTDPNGNTWQATYDDSDMRTFAQPGREPVRITYEAGLPTTWEMPRGGVTTFDYDNQGNLLSIKDALEKTETYTYVAGNRVTRTDREDHTWRYEYYPDRRVRKVIDPLDHATTYTYFPSGQLKDETDATGRVTSYTYWPDGHRKSETRPGNLTTSWTYNELGQIASMTDPAGKVTTYEYYGNGLLKKVIDPLLNETSYEYYRNGLLKSERAADGGVTSYTYDGAGRLATVTDPVGRTTKSSYDLAGRLASTENAAGGITEYEYFDDGTLKLTRDPLGHETSRTYNDDGLLETVTDPRDNTTRQEYDLAGRLRKTIDAGLGETEIGYDGIGQVTSVRNPEDETTFTEYDPAGRVALVRDPLGHETRYGYDDAGRPTSVTDALGHAETRTYDAAGRLDTVRTASGITTTYGYDPRSLLTSIRNALNQETVRTYNDAGWLATERDPRGFTTTFGYDPVGRLKTITDPKTASVTIGYDLAGQQTTITDPRGKVWRTTYHELGGVETTTDPLGRSTLLEYDDAGQLEKKTDARGITVGYGYDPAGNLTSFGSFPENVAYTYDALNRRDTMTDGTGVTDWDFDGASRLTSVETPAGSVGYGYDDAGRRTSMTLPAGTVGYGYHDDNRLATLTDPAGAVTSFSYELDGRSKTISRPNGVVTTNGFDLAGRLTSVTHARGGVTLAAFTYTLDASGNRRSMTTGGVMETYTINELNQLTGVTSPGTTASYTYDEAGNRKSRTVNGATTTYTYDDASQLVNAGGTTYTYDGAGNRLTAGAATFTYDRLGRMATSTVGGTTTSYTYDGDGTRVASTTGGTATPFLSDHATGLAELVGDGSSVYLHANGQLLAEQGATTTTYPLADALGSVRALTNQAGAVVGTSSYDPFGARTASSGASSIFGFAGQQADPSGLVYMRARYLDPATGIFTQVDPVRPGAPGVVGYNPYSYVGNNPTTWRDPSGEQALIEAAARWVQTHPIETALIVAGTLLMWYWWQLAYQMCMAGSCAIDITFPPTTAGNPPIEWQPPNMQETWEQMRRFLKTITEEIARTIVQLCVASQFIHALGGPDICTGRVKPLFITGHLTTKEATDHDIEAITTNLSWVRLTRGLNSENPDGSESQAARGWYRTLPACVAAAKGQDCDEYPFYSTREGGPAVAGRPAGHIKPIDRTHNRSQGASLNVFYSNCRVTNGVSFLVVPLPSVAVPTFGFCRQ